MRPDYGNVVAVGIAGPQGKSDVCLIPAERPSIAPCVSPEGRGLESKQTNLACS